MSENSTEANLDLGQLILIDKPLRWTSFDVVKKLKFAGKFKKIGHAGTLDPLATGLLILCTGKMTKQIDSYQAQEKEYSGKFVLGKTTPSVDLETDFDAEYDVSAITETILNEAKSKLTGVLQQYPPIFSAVKQEGKRLYELARKGQEVAIRPREVNVTSFEINSENFPEIRFNIVCSKGTYIRSLVRDFGELCNSGAYLSELRRERIGSFDVKNALTIEQFIEELN
ncbi:MAG: tRNA pseudouridine(55) synthase TruB [Bacteroidota bacterium]